MKRIRRTPAVVIDERRMRTNVERMAGRAARHGLALRPHIKTHKSLELARIQSDAGAFGFTASKPEEAAVFAAAGIPSITVAYPLVETATIVELIGVAAKGGCELRFVVDSTEGLAALERAVVATSSRAAVYLEVDVGLGRCGLAPDSPLLHDLARSISDHHRLHFEGILSHAGHAYSAADRAAVAAIAEAERATMIGVRERLRDDGIDVSKLSVGSTPTVLASDSFEGIDEIRPGNYIVLDGIQVGLGVASYDEVALWVETTIVSRNAGHYIVDAGSKSLSSDRGAHGAERPAGYGAAFAGAVSEGCDVLKVERLSEEHGFVERGSTDLRVGDRLRIVPNHACPVINLARTLVLAGDEDREITVDAGGCVH